MASPDPPVQPTVDEGTALAIDRLADAVTALGKLLEQQVFSILIFFFLELVRRRRVWPETGIACTVTT